MQTRIHLKPVFFALAFALGGLLAPSSTASPAALAATSFVVNDGGSDCGPYALTHASIQAAVTEAISNKVKTILVCPGTYTDFDVVGAKTLTIKAALPGTFPLVNAPTATSGRIVDVRDSSGVVLDGLKIDGANFNDALSFTSYGIYFQNASGTVQNSSVSQVRCFPNGCLKGIGINLLDNNGDGKVSSLTVKNVSITDIDQEGIHAEGPTKLTVSGVRIIGNVSGGAGVVPNGVVFYHNGAAGSVTKSRVSQIWAGVEMVGASKVTVTGNAIDSGQYGVFIDAACLAGGEVASSNKVSGNTISDVVSYGVVISSSGSGCTHADKNAISGNLIIADTGGAIAGVILSPVAGAFADKNKISGNTIFGFADDVATDPDATHTSISGNTWIP